MQCKLYTNFINNSRTFYPKKFPASGRKTRQMINLNFCILQMQHMYGISWLQYSSSLGKIFQCQKSENMMGLTEIRTGGMFGQRTCDDLRVYKENAMHFLALSSKHFPTWKLLQSQQAPKAGDFCAHTKVLMRAAWQDTISIWMLKIIQLYKAGLHQIREVHLKHFHLCTLN